MRLKSDLILLFVAAVWGTGFVAQRLATTQLGTFYFNGGRFILAALLILLLTRFQKTGLTGTAPRVQRKDIPWMLLAGTILFGAVGFQQAGLVTTSISNAGFITGLYVVFVPLILFAILRQR